MFKTPYGQTPIFCSAEPPSLQLRLSSPMIPIGSWSDHPPSLTFISPNLFRENRTFFHLKTQTSHFLPQNSNAGSFPRLLLLRSFGLAFGISLWSRCQQKGTTHMKQLQTKVNRNSPKKNKETKNQRDPLFKSEAKILRSIYDLFPFSKHRFNFPPFSLLPPWLHFSVVLLPWILQILTVYMLKWRKKWDVKVYKFIHHHCVFDLHHSFI